MPSPTAPRIATLPPAGGLPPSVGEDRRTRYGWVLAWVLYALVLGAALGGGQLRTIGYVVGATMVGVAVVRPEVLFWLVVPAVALFDEYAYGVADPESVFRLHRFGLTQIPLNIDELLVYPLLVILVIHIALRQRKAEPLPLSVGASAFAAGAIVVLQVGRAMAGRVPIADAMSALNGKYVLLFVVALWCFVQVLQSEGMRARLLDVLFALCGARALFALARYVFGEGDPANAYRELGLKVALWESTDHLLFTFLAATAVAALLLGSVGRKRAWTWLALSVPMVVTVLLSYRRTGWFGLLLTLCVLGIAIGGGKAIPVLAAAVAVAAGGASVMAPRLGQGGTLLERLFPDIEATSGPRRLDDWVLAWEAIRRNAILGNGVTAERGVRLGEDSAGVIHNAWLFLWIKMGVFAVAAVGALVAAVTWLAWKAARGASRERFVALAVLSTVPYIVLEMSTGTPLIEVRHVLAFAMLFALAICVSNASVVPPEAVGAK